jgi:hypothetical protein
MVVGRRISGYDGAFVSTKEKVHGTTLTPIPEEIETQKVAH